jgi:hypothetical protein
MNTLTRNEFLTSLARVLLAAMLAIIALLLGSRTVRGNECSDCPGRGICKGDSDCSLYLNRSR